MILRAFSMDGRVIVISADIKNKKIAMMVSSYFTLGFSNIGGGCTHCSSN